MRSFLAWLARQAPLRQIVLSTPGVRDLAWRFVAGESLETGLKVVEALNLEGIDAALNLVGTHVYDKQEALRATEALVGAVCRINKERCYLSIKLTQIGLDIEERFCVTQLNRVLAAAADAGVFVRVDMEEANYVRASLRLFEEARRRFGSSSVGIAIQSYLRGRESDLDRLIDERSHIRLVKGGYWAQGDVVFLTKQDINAQFEADLDKLMARASHPAIAPHDPCFIKRTLEFAEKFQRSRQEFEFQMLYGVETATQRALVKEGCRVRCYVPYGGAWFAYFLGCVRRLPEGILRQWRARPETNRKLLGVP